MGLIEDLVPQPTLGVIQGGALVGYREKAVVAMPKHLPQRLFPRIGLAVGITLLGVSFL